MIVALVLLAAVVLRGAFFLRCERCLRTSQRAGGALAVDQQAHRSGRRRGGMLRLSAMSRFSLSVSTNPSQEPRDERNAS